MTLDVGTSQWTQSVRMSNTKIELSVSTMKTCETCQFVLTHVSFNMHCQNSVPQKSQGPHCGCCWSWSWSWTVYLYILTEKILVNKIFVPRSFSLWNMLLPSTFSVTTTLIPRTFPATISR